MVSEETAQRIARALERLATAVERGDVVSAMAALPDDVNRSDIRYMTRILPTTEKLVFTCYRCIPSHTLDWDNPCKNHRSTLERKDHGRRDQACT